jgi:hypothetical protein
MHSGAVHSAQRSSFEHLLRIGFWVCVVIAVLVVIRRVIALASAAAPSSASPFGNLDASFASHAPLTLAHIIPALCFVLITPVIVFGRASLARSLQRVWFPLGLVVGVTAYGMSVYAEGG